jgi:NAD(P)-dependent dehydrogenase (short-subunit alcohol dehydrogenase family)
VRSKSTRTASRKGRLRTRRSDGMGTANDIGKAALFLASEDSGWVTGEELLVGVEFGLE